MGAFAVSAILMHDAQATDTPLNIPGPAKLTLDSSTGIVGATLPNSGFLLAVFSYDVGSPEYVGTMRQIATAFKQINCPYFARIHNGYTPRAARIEREILIEKIKVGNTDYAKHNGQNLPIETPTAVFVENDIEKALYTPKMESPNLFVCIPVKPAYLFPKTYAATAEYL